MSIVSEKGIMEHFITNVIPLIENENKKSGNNHIYTTNMYLQTTAQFWNEQTDLEVFNLDLRNFYRVCKVVSKDLLD